MAQDLHFRIWEPQKDGIHSQLGDLEAELREYEKLKSDGPTTLKLDSLDALPQVLIKARLAAGHTHENLAARVGFEPQQIQRYEASDYQTIGLARLLGIACVLYLRVHEDSEFHS